MRGRGGEVAAELLGGDRAAHRREVTQVRSSLAEEQVGEHDDVTLAGEALAAADHLRGDAVALVDHDDARVGAVGGATVNMGRTSPVTVGLQVRTGAHGRGRACGPTVGGRTLLQLRAVAHEPVHGVGVHHDEVADACGSAPPPRRRSTVASPKHITIGHAGSPS
jgi:hypothetical protein